MIVISDTTPILSLLKGGQLGLLEKLYDSVVVPQAVYEEMVTNPVFVDERREILKCPFLRVENIQNQEHVRILRNKTGLDEGESEALILYREQKADLLLMDEHKGRSVAKKMSVKHVGTVGILMLAYDKGIISASEVVECLEILLDRNIRLSKNLCNKVLHYIGLDKKF